MEGTIFSRSTQNDAVSDSKPAVPSPIVDKFRAMLREREEEIRDLGMEDEGLTTEEAVAMYEVVLGELTVNSKPIITELTIIAGDQREHGEGIADAICARIIEVQVDQKLPSLYLLDSIVKNIGKEYVGHFSARLPEVFCAAYRQVHPNLHPSMRHLFGTWSTVFPSSVLRRIESQLQFSPLNHQQSGLRSTESPRPTHGIHVNPKYLEARRQLENSTVDNNIQHAKGTMISKMHGKPAIEFEEYDDSDDPEAISSYLGTGISSSASHMDRRPFPIDAKREPPSSGARIAGSSSAFGQSRQSLLQIDESAFDESQRTVTDGPSPSRLGFEHRFSSKVRRDADLVIPQNDHWSGGASRRFEATSKYALNSELDNRGPRALINAYGTDHRTEMLGPNHLKPRKLDINGIDSKVGVNSWRNTEEEEFEWEDMSPTLDHDRPTVFESFSKRPSIGAWQSASMDTDFHGGNWVNREKLPAVNASSLHDKAPSSLSSDHRLGNQISGFHKESSELPVSHQTQEPWQQSHPFISKLHGLQSQIPFTTALTADVQKPPGISFPGAEPQHRFPSNITSRLNPSCLNPINPDVPSSALVVPVSTGAWRPPLNIQNSLPPPTLPSVQLQNQGSPFDPVLNEGQNKSLLHLKQFDGMERQTPSQIAHFRGQNAGQFSFSPQIPAQAATFPAQVSRPQEFRQNLFPPALAANPSHLVLPHMNHGYAQQRYDSSGSIMSLNHIPAIAPPRPVLHFPMPPLPPGPHPCSSQRMPNVQNPGQIAPNPQPVLSDLFSSLVAQGVITLANQTPSQDSVGLEFDAEVLKERHESAITALYTDLPRQCTTCGLRFKSQEEHRSHMDWHVTKNRISRSRKQKPSRKWFVNVSMWLSSAETLGTDSVPGFLAPSEDVPEKKDEEMAVPADEDQNVCALCGEPFEDFYSDETEEWMYRDAVYMNAPTGSTIGVDRSQLGPIVHAKCRSETNVVSPEDFGKNEVVYNEEDSQRKRLKS